MQFKELNFCSVFGKGLIQSASVLWTISSHLIQTKCDP